MDCNQIKEQLELQALGEPFAQDALKKHLAACVECRQWATFLSDLSTELKRELSEPSPLALHKLQDAINAESATPEKFRRITHKKIRLLLKVAAAVMVATGALLLWQNFPGPALTTKSKKSWSQAGLSPVMGNRSAYPLVTDNQIYALSSEADGKRLVAFDRRSGKCLWKTKFYVVGLPVAAGQKIFAWRQNQAVGLELLALDQRDGRIIWTHTNKNLARQERPIPLTVTASLISWSQGDTVCALENKNGQTRWIHKLDSDSNLSTPDTDEQHLFVASDTTLFALRVADGAMAWQKELLRPQSLFPRPQVCCADGRVAVARVAQSRRGCLEVFDSANGSPLWQQQTVAPYHLVMAQNKIFIRGTVLQAYDAAAGQLAWSATLGGCSPVTVAGNCVYALDSIDRASGRALSAASGQPVWDRPALSSCSGLEVRDGFGYLVTQSGNLLTFNI